MSKALSLNEIRSRCAVFAADWRDAEGYERGEAQEFVRELLHCFGIAGRRAAFYEKRAQRSSTGKQGYIDALIPGLCLIEMKSAGRNLAAAEEQALDYCDSLTDAEQPRWILTSDFRNFRLLDIESNCSTAENPALTFTLAQLPPRCEDLAFFAGYQVRKFGDAEQERASTQAALLMASLYDGLAGSGYDDHEASIFLVRTLFCLYADDSGIWERDLFFEFVSERTNSDGTDLGPQLALLYQVMNRPTDKRQKNLDELMARFPYVNGGIFAEPLTIPAFDGEMRTKLLECCAFNWSQISPAIFGSLFQAVKSKQERRALGEHYTTETNIRKTIDPLFLDEHTSRFQAHRNSVRGLKNLRREISYVRVLETLRAEWIQIGTTYALAA